MADQFETLSRRELLGRAKALNERFGDADTEEILHHAVVEEYPGQIAVVSSFGAESSVLLHLLSRVDPAVPVIFLDTGKHFSETLDYVETLKSACRLTDVRIVHPKEGNLAADDPDGTLNERDPERCCYIRKTLPMIRALNPFRAWITGRKRFQGNERSTLDVFEVQDRWLKVNPLAGWDKRALTDYMQAHDLPAQPLVALGFPSIGCAPCTTPVSSAEDDPRAGRWRGQEKTECGIHLPDNRHTVEKP